MRIPLSGMPHQLRMGTNTDENGDRFPDRSHVAMIGPYGCGKTRALAVKAALFRMGSPRVDGLLVPPTYDMFTLIHQQKLPEVWDEMGLRYKWHGQRKAWDFPDFGNRLWVRSAEKPSRLVGAELADVHFDEPGLMVKEAYDRAGVRARHPQAAYRQVCLYGTPEGLNWVADLFDHPRPPRYTIRASTWHPSIADYRATLKDQFSYDPHLFDAYVRGQFVPLRQGRAYGQFVREKHVDGRIKPDPHLALVLACDFNVDAMRWVIMQVHHDWIRAYDEIALGGGASTIDAAQEFVRRYADTKRRVIVTGDAAGQARSTSGQTDYQIIEEELYQHFLDVRKNVPPGNPRQKERVDAANYHLAGRGRHVTIHRKCEHLIKDLERVQWRQGTSELDKKDPMLTHASDAFTYAVWRMAPVKAMKGRTAKRKPGETMRDEIMGAQF